MHHSTFEYLKPTEAQLVTMSILRSGARAYAAVLENALQPSADKSYCIRKLREIAMWANVAATRHDNGGPRMDFPDIRDIRTPVPSATANDSGAGSGRGVRVSLKEQYDMAVDTGGHSPPVFVTNHKGANVAEDRPLGHRERLWPTRRAFSDEHVPPKDPIVDKDARLLHHEFDGTDTYTLTKESLRNGFTLQTWETPEGKCSVAKWPSMSNREACNSARSWVTATREHNLRSRRLAEDAQVTK